jgi:hypothetical protein
MLGKFLERPDRVPTDSASPFCHFVHDIVKFLVLILVRVQGETNNPGPGTDTPHAVSIRG